MVSIAREILLHDKLRFLITVASLGFTIVMMVYNMGVFFGVVGDDGALIDRAHADLWVSEEDETHLNAPSRVPRTTLRWARRLDGVNQVCALDYSLGNLKIGDTQLVTVIGIDPTCPLFQPWDLAKDDVDALQRRDTIIVDDLALRGINHAQLGDIVELNEREMRIVGVTHGNKSFSYAYVYVNFQTFEDIAGTAEHYSFVAVQLESEADRGRIARQLMQASSKVTVSTAREFRLATMMALIAQGVGMIFVIVFVGVAVGMLIITLTMYTATMERLRDFAILKALGATRWKVWTIVLEQAIIEATVSFGIGLAASLGADRFVETVSGIRGRFPVPMVAGSFAVMVVLAIVGSLVSIRKATGVDPVMVFRR
jgi:putative ABC transport system permease protein